MEPINQRRTLEGLPQEVLETIAEFCGDVARVSPSEQTDTFTDNLIHPFLDSAASNQWQPDYKDLRALSLVSKKFLNPAQRALFKVAVVNTTSALMRLVRCLLQFPEKRRYVRCFVAAIQDHVRPLPGRFVKPQPLVLGEFTFYVYPLLSTTAVQGLPHDSFFRRTAPLLQDTFHRLNRNNFSFSLSLIDSTAINLHTLEDQVMTAIIQLCPKLTATRLCFGAPNRHPERPQPASQPIQDPPLYATLLDDRHSQLKSLTLDFGALLALTNIKRYVPGYPTGLPPSVERLTLVGNEIDSNLPYHLFDLTIFSKWLGTNRKLRELRMLHGFDKLISYKRFHNSHPQGKNWNDVLLTYRNTLEILEMDWYGLFHAVPQVRFGVPWGCKLECLPEMEKLRSLRVPLHALSSSGFGLPQGAEDWEVTWFMRTGLPPWWRKIDVMVMNPGVGGSGEVSEEGKRKEWKVLKLRL